MDRVQTSRVDRTSDRAAGGGFTLIELLIVIGVISLLVAAFSPAILGALGRGEEAETSARQTGLVAMIEGFQRVHGFYPPDDFTQLDQQIKGIQLKADPYNAGIESLVIYLSWEDKGGGRLDEHEDWLGNTDADSNGVTIPLLSRQQKMEVVDAWGTPFAYFSAKTGSGYAGAQKIRLAGDPPEVVTAKPYKNPRSDAWLSPRGFQLISAGPDRVFNTEDDLVHPPLPIED